LMSIIKHLVGLYRYAAWRYQCSKVDEKIINDNVSIVDSKERYLILAPHSDDEWVGASRIIVDENYETVLCCMNMPGGDSDDIRKKRIEEFVHTAQNYNRTYRACRGNLGEIISEVKPSVIMVPFIVDWHDEHIEVIKLLAKQIETAGCIEDFRIMMYQVSVPIPTSFITHMIMMNRRERKEKWKHFKYVYKTQESFPFQRFSINEVINGKIFNSHAAEVFCLMNSLEWINFINKLCPSNSERKEMKERINNLISIREYTKDYIEKKYK